MTTMDEILKSSMRGTGVNGNLEVAEEQAVRESYKRVNREVEITERLTTLRRVYSTVCGWEKGCPGLSGESYQNVVDSLRNSSHPNHRIFLMSIAVPEIFSLLTKEQRMEIAQIAQGYTEDNRMCEIGYPGTQADEEDDRTVSKSAKNLLARIAA